MTRYEAARSALLASVSLMDSARRLQEAANAMLETVAYDLANEAKFEKQLAEFRWLARTSNDAMAFVNDAEMNLFTSNATESFERDIERAKELGVLKGNMEFNPVVLYQEKP